MRAESRISLKTSFPVLYCIQVSLKKLIQFQYEYLYKLMLKLSPIAIQNLLLPVKKYPASNFRARIH